MWSRFERLRAFTLLSPVEVGSFESSTESISKFGGRIMSSNFTVKMLFGHSDNFFNRTISLKIFLAPYIDLEISLMSLMATFTPVILLVAEITSPKAPYPR